MNLGPLTIQAPVLLLGLLAAGIPVLLHLLAKVRAPQVFFPTLRFLRMSMDKTARRRRVQHWLLLLLRMAALAVLAMAVAQPLVQASRGKFGSDRDTAAVIVLDNSLSMRVGPAGATRLDQAREAAVKLLADRNFPEVALIVTNGPAGQSTGMIDRFKLKERVSKVEPGNGQADLFAAVAQAEELLAASKQPNKEIYLFSDLQECSAGGLAALTSASEKRGRSRPSLLAIVPSASRPVPGPGNSDERSSPMNLAVTAVELDQPMAAVGQKVFFNVTAQNFWHLPQKAKVVAFIDGLERDGVAQSLAALPAGGSQTVTIEWTFSSPGVHTGWFGVRIDGAKDDDLPQDDRRHFALDVADRVKVLLLKPRHEMERSDDAGFWLSKVAKASLPGEQSVPIDVTEMAAGDSANLLTEQALAGRQVLISSNLADLDILKANTPTDSDDDAASQPDAAPLAAIRRFVRSGGTWMIFLGPEADLPSYNALLTDRSGGEPMLDGRLDRYAGNATGGRDVDAEAAPSVAWVDATHPMFANLYGSPAPYRRVFIYRHAVIHLPSGSASRPIATLSTADPLVVETPVGRGRVLLFATAATTRWTSWVRQPQALAIRQMMLASRSSSGAILREYHESEPVAIELPVDSGAPARSARISITGPDGTKASADARPAGDRLAAAFQGADRLGVYKWTAADEQAGMDDSGPGRGAFAVNVPHAESNLAALDAKQLADLMPDRFVLAGRSVAELDEQIEQSRHGSPLWPYLLAAVMVVLAVEAKIANRNRPSGEESLRPALSR